MVVLREDWGTFLTCTPKWTKPDSFFIAGGGEGLQASVAAGAEAGVGTQTVQSGGVRSESGEA